MRKLYILLVLILGPLVTILAQPTMTVGDGTACTGETFCVPFSVKDFTNINSLRFSINYDTSVLRYTTAQNFHPDMIAPTGNLGISLFNEATLGEISFDTWETGDCTNSGNIGVTLPDEATIFEVCFEAVGAYGDQTAINITNTPTSILCTRNATQCNNIGLLIDNGDVTLCVREFNLTASDVSGNEGDQVCVDFAVEGFDGLSSMQFTVNYDPAFLTFVNLFPNTQIPNNALGAYGLPGQIDVGPGNITVVWNPDINAFPNGVTVVDGTTFFTACFTIEGSCETSSQITYSDTPTRIEVGNADPDNPDQESPIVPVSLNPGLVTVNDCDPEGIQITIDCGAPVNINDIVCVNFSAGDNFNAVRNLEYLMSWNPNILEFVSVSDPGNLSNLGPEDFDTSNIDNGILGLEWSFTAGPAQNMDNMELIYEVCFRVVGIGGDSPVQILTPGVGVSNNVNIGIAPENCNVQVIQPESLLIDFGDLSVPLNGTDCVPVTASNFNAMLEVDFSMAWDENIWSYTGTVQNIHPSLISNGPPTFTPIGASSLAFQFGSVSPVTIPDNTTLFEVCFQAVGDPGDCDLLITVGFPFPERAVTENSGGANVGIETFAGDLCVLFPDGFGLTAENTTIGWLDTVCMNFTVESFDDIIAAEFAVNWDPTALDYVSSTAIGWAPSDVTFTIIPAGTLQAAYNVGTPSPLADGDIAFEVCFQAIGDPNDCYGVSIQDNPLPAVATTGGPGSIVITNGEICVEDQIVIREIIIVPPSCPGTCDGSVQIIIEEWEGQGFIGTTWKTMPNQFTPLMLDDVCEGELCFTVFDNSSGVSLTDTINIVSNGIVPTAIINGEDVRTINCSDGQVLVSAQDQGPGFTYTWWENTVGGEFCGDERTIFATSPGRKILVVTDQMSGCVAYDTIMILAPELPEAIVQPVAQGVTCNNECVTLQGSGVGENLSYQWSIVMGDPATVDSTTIQTPQFVVCGPGRYRLKVTDMVTGCMNSTEDAFDEVVVTDDGITPNACVNPIDGGDIEVEQNCDGTAITFSASCSNNDGLQVDYQWFNVEANGDFITPAFGIGLSTNQSDLGTYALLVTEMTTGCTDTAFARIIPNTNAPSVGITPPPAFTCNTDSIILSASLVPNDPTFTFEWVLSGGATLTASSTLTPAAQSPGTYRLIVTNPANLCQADSTVIIEDLTAPPVAQILDDPANLLLSCTNPSLTLDGTLSEDGMSYQWCNGDGTPISAATMDTLQVNMVGDYILKVTNLATGCTAADTVTVDGNFETPMLTPSAQEGIVSCRNPEVSTTVTVAGVDMYTVSEWTTVDGNVVSTSLDGLTVTVDAAGVYNVVVTSSLSGCTSEVDFIVEEDFNEPTVNVTSNTLTITCQEETVQLSGAGSATGQNITYLWENLDGTGDPVAPTDIQTNTLFAGTYLFTVTDTLNGCSADTMVMVLTDTIAPVGMIAPVDDITCADLSRELNVTVTGADDFIINWIGSPLPSPTMGTPVTANTVGLFTAVVTNTANACQDTVSITVGGDVTPPAIEIAEPDQMDCGDESVTLSLSTDAALYSSIQWSGPDGLLGADPTQEATALGEYIVMVNAVANGCPAADTVIVTTVDDLTLPTIADPGLLPQFDCSGDPITIDVSATGNPNDYADISWTGNAFEATMNPFIINALEAGVFTITVELEGPVPGCINSLPIAISLDEATPTALAGPDVELVCGETGMLNASGSTPPSAVFAYEWLTVNGPDLTTGIDGPTPSVSAAGMYQLVVSNIENQCSDTSAVMTVSVLPADFAITIDDVDVLCGETGMLSAVADLAPSATVQYNWIVAGAGPELEDNTATPSVNEAGMYQLIITNTENGCVDTSEVATVNLLLPPAANAGADQALCSDEGDLSANLPAGVTGLWTTTSGAIVDMPDAPATMVSNLDAGSNSFVWTLSTNVCPSYSADTVILNRAPNVVANPDFLELASDEVMGEVSLIANDITGGANYEITIISPPAFGSFDTTALGMGNLVYLVDLLEFGETELTYELCSTDCPDLCDTATVSIMVAPRDDTFVPNTITPNDDGANDQLIFDVLLFNPAEEFPDNELIIFNRWGDIIYEAKPYNNDWTGVSQDGKPVPEATYYYILRLNVSRGEILRGDITVIR